MITRPSILWLFAWVFLICPYYKVVYSFPLTTCITIVINWQCSNGANSLNCVISHVLLCYSCCNFLCFSAKMNIMRKLIGSSSNSTATRSGGGMLYDGANAASQSGGGGQTDYTLGLMHLRKLFTELKSQPANSSQKDLENMLYNMLPLFCKVSRIVKLRFFLRCCKFFEYNISLWEHYIP
jgi:hypothetical protein